MSSRQNRKVRQGGSVAGDLENPGARWATMSCVSFLAFPHGGLRCNQFKPDSDASCLDKGLFWTNLSHVPPDARVLEYIAFHFEVLRWRTADLSTPSSLFCYLYLRRENPNWTYDVGPSTWGVHRGLEIKDLRELKDLTIHDVQPLSDE